MLVRLLCRMQNRLLRGEISHLAHRRDIGRAIELRALIRRLEAYADAVDLEIS